MTKEKKGGVARFHLSDEARDYFVRMGVERHKGKSSTGMFSAFIEPYFLCMILGMAKDSSRDPDKMTPDMIREWASHTKDHEYLISGLVFYQYCKERKIENDDGVLTKMNEFFSPDRNSTYDKAAFEMMNGFAQGGFDVIREFGPLSELSDFLLIYLGELEVSL